ncbi:hypothetical protein PG984_001339 [Apiospora sp. TS-2023a]
MSQFYVPQYQHYTTTSFPQYGTTFYNPTHTTGTLYTVPQQQQTYVIPSQMSTMQQTYVVPPNTGWFGTRGLLAEEATVLTLAEGATYVIC